MIRRRITFANVTSFVALFVALSAGSYAAIALPANSVGPKQIKAKAVTSAKLASRAVDGSKVKDQSLTGSDINADTLGKVPSAAAADKIAGIKVASAQGTSRPSDSNGSPLDATTASCDSGLVATGGGVALSSPGDQLVFDSFPSGSSAWTAHVANFGTGTPTFTVYVICAPAASTQ